MKKNEIFANIILSSLAIVSIYLAIADITGQLIMRNNLSVMILDILIWLVFTFDYIYRYIKSEDKKHYVKNNWLDSLAIIPVPFIAMLTNSPLVAWLRLFRVLAFLDELRDGFSVFMKQKGVAYAIYILIVVVIGASLGIYFVEKGTTVNSLSDAFWWSIVTTTTVGYGDISPKTGVGRMIAVTLMLTGVSVFGIVMSSFADILTKKNSNLESCNSELVDISGLSEGSKRSIHSYIEFLRQQEGDNE